PRRARALARWHGPGGEHRGGERAGGAGADGRQAVAARCPAGALVLGAGPPILERLDVARGVVGLEPRLVSCRAHRTHSSPRDVLCRARRGPLTRRRCPTAPPPPAPPGSRRAPAASAGTTATAPA